ncbi:MAG: hypothetical protein NVS3B3_05950 [Aquirhabdus sp.]
MWPKKFSKLSGMVSPEAQNMAGPNIAPVGESQPAMATTAMSQDMKPMSVPDQLPNVPKLAAQPNMSDHLKKRALANIAMGKKGF